MLVFLRKNTRIHKNGRNSCELFVLALSLVWFAGATPGVLVQKNPRVRKIFVRNSGAGNGCANFMGAWKKCVLSAGITHVHKIPPVRGGDGILGFGGGGSADFIFMGARIFLSSCTRLRVPPVALHVSRYTCRG